MAITAVPNLIEYEFTPFSERKNENPTTFTLKPLDGIENMKVCSELVPDGLGGADLSQKGSEICLEFGLVGWDNFNDENGRPIIFHKVNFGKIPALTLSEIATEIFVRAEMGEAERKNS